MKFLYTIILLFCVIQNSTSQQLVCSTQDQEAFESKIIAIDGLLETEFGNTITAIGTTFIGTPYVANTLEVAKHEPLVINLQGLDCTTFVENVLAFSTLLKKGETAFSTFTKTLETIRYKDAIRDGYASRLHYFTEWIANNEKKGFLKNITSELGGIETSKNIDFMSTHRERYPFLKTNAANFSKIKASEKFLNEKALCILELDAIKTNEHRINSGDIIALTTAIKGLDVTHTGIAIREKDGRIHLLHASSSGAVKITKEPLVEYLQKIKHITGIMVSRPL